MRVTDVAGRYGGEGLASYWSTTRAVKMPVFSLSVCETVEAKIVTR